MKDIKFNRIAEIERRTGNAFAKVAISPDGKMVATASRTIEFWDTETGKQVSRIPGSHGPIMFVAFMEDGKSLFSRDEFGFRFWDLETKTVRAEVPFGGTVPNVGISSDERSFAAGIGNSLFIWDVKTLSVVQEHVFPQECCALAFSPVNNLLACSSGHCIEICSLSPFSVTNELAAHTDSVYGLSFSTDGKLLISTGLDRSVRVWSTEDFSEVSEISETHEISSNCACLSNRGNLLATGGSDGHVRVWNWKTKDLVSTLRVGDPSKKRQRNSIVISLTFSPDDNMLIFGGSSPNHLQFWERI